MRGLLQDWYSDMPPLNDMGTSAVAWQYRAHCCKAAYQSNYILHLEEDVTTAVTNAACLGVGLGAVCVDVVESLNAILKRAYNNHAPRGGGGISGAISLEKEAEVVSQVLKWWFLKFDLPLRILKFDPPLRTVGTPHVAPCTMATLMSNHSPPSIPISLAPPPLVRPIHGPSRSGGFDEQNVGKDDRQSGMCLCVCVCVFACLRIEFVVCNLLSQFDGGVAFLGLILTPAVV